MEHRRPYPGEPRTIDVWCEARSHDPVLIGQLTSYRVASREVWTVTGPHATTEQLVRAVDSYKVESSPTAEEANRRRDIMFMLGLVAEKCRLRCPRCGLDVVAGDRLASWGGVRALWGKEPGNWDRLDSRALAASKRTDVALSQVADAGVSRLSLAAVDRIFGLVIR